MQEIIEPLMDALERARPVAYCRVIETRGSTPQKPGATMLVFADGSQAGTLGGGCVEAEVKRRALAALASGEASIETFQLDHDFGWDDGLICGGRMIVSVQPVTGRPAERDYYAQLIVIQQRGGGTEAIVHDAAKSGLAKGTCYLLDGSDALAATLHASGASVPRVILDALQPIARRPIAYGAPGIAMLPILPHCRLVIVGGGHIGRAVAGLATDLDFDVWVIDDRDEFVSVERFPLAERRLSGDLADILSTLEITADTYCLVVTRGHRHDELALLHLLDRGARYVGMIGSRRKVRTIFDDLMNEGVSEDVLNRVHAPVGLDIGSQTVAEIAISICAELIACRNLREDVSSNIPAQ